jgi:hypothetical protein
VREDRTKIKEANEEEKIFVFDRINFSHSAVNGMLLRRLFQLYNGILMRIKVIILFEKERSDIEV